MSFQAYLASIQARTGNSPADFRALAENKGFTQNGQLASGVNAGAIDEITIMTNKYANFERTEPPISNLP